MKASWTDVQQIEAYLLCQDSPEQRLDTETRLLTDTSFYELVRWQRSTYAYVEAYGRAQLKKQIQQVEEQLFSKGAFNEFNETIKNIFSL